MLDKKKSGPKKPFTPPVVKVRDPRTGMSATSLTKGGALAKLQSKVGKKVQNPFVSRKP